MKQRSLKFVQITLVLALLLGNVGPIMAASPSLALATPIAASAAPDLARPNRLVQLKEPQGRAEALPAAEVSVAGQNALGWTKLITDTFDAFPANWSTYTETVEQTWGPTMVDADTEYNPDSLNSVWPAAAGLDAVDPISGTYPNNLESWMIRGPIDLSGWLAAELDFSLNYDIEEGDWLGICVAGFISAPSPSDFDQDADCSWLYGTTDGWEYDYLDLTGYVGETELYIAFVFQSDDSNEEPYFGAFVDELVLWVNDEEVDATDPDGDFVDWAEIYSEAFDTLALDSDAKWKLESVPGGTGWVTTTAMYDDINPLSDTSTSPTPGDSYSAGQQSWMFYGPLDLSEQVAADIFFTTYYDLLYSDDDDTSNDDWLAICAFAADKVLADISSDDVHYDSCDWSSGWSGDAWEDGFFDLTPFAGRSQVYVGWYFEANNDNNAGGVYVDEVFIEAQSADAPIPPAVTFDPNGIVLENGDFANGLTNWDMETPSGKSGNVAVENGRAALTGNQLLTHDFVVPQDVEDLNVHFRYAFSTTESSSGNDIFCMGLTTAADHTTFLADLGCWDANHVPEFARDGATSAVYGYNIPHNLVASLTGQSLSLVIELAQNDTQPSTLFLDDIVIYLLGKTPRDPSTGAARTSSIAADDVAAHRDPNEPNDNTLVATPLACNQTKAGLFGDVVPTTPKDQELFKIDRVPVGKLVIDVNAATLQPASSADTLLRIYDSTFTLVATFDDDGKTLDSFGVFTNTVADATYYVNLYNFNDDGPTAYYTINAKCGQVDAPPPAAPAVVPPTTPTGDSSTWTMILFLNGEDQNCVAANSRESCWDKATYERVIQAMEGMIGAKQDFMNVVVLLDGPNFPGTANDVTRYVVQPNGQYTLGVNKWNLPELNMGDPKTLVDFATWAISNYPADHYYLAVDDHGSGLGGSSFDHHGVGGVEIDDGITPAEMHSAMSQITLNGQRKIDIFAYEACLMGLTENTYDLKNYANYLTTFQSVSWTALQYPAYFKDLTATDTVEQVARRIIQTFPTTNAAYTFALIQADKLDMVKTRLDAFSNALMGVDAAALKALRDATQGFGGSPAGGVATWLGYIDLWDFAQRVKAAGHAVNEATALQAAIDAAVIEKKAVAKVGLDDYTNYHGLSIIYPEDAYGNFDRYCQDYRLSDSGQGGWAKLMTTKVGICGGIGAAQTNGTLAIEDRQVNVPLFLIPKEDTQATIYLPVTAK